MAEAKSTGVQTGTGAVAQQRNAAVGTGDATTSTTEKPARRTPSKYRHVVAVHSVTRPSCLSHDSNATPSFLGFRNLMVIVLGECQHRCAAKEC